MRGVVVHESARRELAAARDFYDVETAGYGLLFVEAIEYEVARLVEFPLIGKPIIRGARRWVLRDWPYSIIYQPILGGVYIIAIAHHSRRPNYWRRRLR